MWQRSGPRADIETLRDIVFRRALTVGLILAFPVVSVAVWHRASQGNFTMVVIDCLLYAIAIFVTTIANRHVQTLLISVVLWTLGTIVYINLGPRSEGLAPFLVLIAFLSVMYDRAVYVGGIVAALFGLCSAIAFRGYTAGRTPVEYLSAEPWTPWLSDFFQLGLF